MAMSKPELQNLIARAPGAVLRMKAIVPNKSGGILEAHLVGEIKQIIDRSEASMIGVVAIGLEAELDPGRLQDWWASNPDRSCTQEGAKKNASFHESCVVRLMRSIVAAPTLKWRAMAQMDWPSLSMART